MSLAAGDLTTPASFAAWSGLQQSGLPTSVPGFIASASGLLYAKMNRARTFSQTFVRVFDGVGNMQIVLPDYPVTQVISVQQAAAIVPQSSLPPPPGQTGGTSYGYGWRCPLWAGDLPGTNSVIEFNNGAFYAAPQGIKITYVAGYLIQSEPATIPATSPFQVTVQQPLGTCCKDAGVVYASSGVALTAVASAPTAGQYVPPADALPGVYTFSSADTATGVLISYSFIPAELQDACNQMVAERLAYTSRVGVVSKSLGGQETMRFSQAGVPPQVAAMIEDYCSVVPPVIGAPV